MSGVAIEGMSRSAFMLRAALGVGTLAGVGAVQSFVSTAFAQDEVVSVRPGGSRVDLEILQFALTLELLEAEYYERALAEATLSESSRELAQLIGENERQHVEKLKTVIDVLGGKPTKPPKFKFPFSDDAAFLELAEALEDTGVGAYNGAAPSVESLPVLAAAGGIVQVEARHAAAVKMARGVSVTPAFSKALDMDEVFEAAGKYIKGS